MANRFYVNYPLGAGAVALEGAEAHHLAAVCRLRPGDQVSLFNGDGSAYRAAVTAVSRHRVDLQVLAVDGAERELDFTLEVAAPVPKGDRGQFLLEKLTELGVTTFVPLRTQRSVVHPGETRLDKMQRHVIEASKQCLRNVLLEVAGVTSWESYSGRGDLPATRLMAHPSEEPVTLELFGAAHSDGLVVAVGPEGGFTEEEVSRARSNGWRLVSLGPRILRVETAAIVLAAWAIAAKSAP